MVVIRRCWSCGEADWLTTVAGVKDLRSTVGFPLRFTARQVVDLLLRGVTPEEACAPDFTPPLERPHP